MAIYDGSDPRMQQGGNRNQLRPPSRMGSSPMFGNMAGGRNAPMFGGGSGMMGGRGPGGGYGQQRSGYGHPKPMYPGHPNHPDYLPGPGRYDPNRPETHPSPPPRIPSLWEHWQHQDEIQQFGRGIKEWLQGSPAIPGSQATPKPTQKDPKLTDDEIDQLIWRPFDNPNIYPKIPGQWWLENPQSPPLQPWGPMTP